MTKQRLELDWVGKDEKFILEPRILIEKETLSVGAKTTQNLLIHGDNLLGLKALENDFSGKIQCVYIDPPFNTQQAFEHYDDGLEHSLWLSMMKARLEIIHKLICASGSLFIHIDDNELGYLIALADEVFGRNNRISIITFKQGAATGHKAINKGVVNTSNFILIYAKNKSEWKNKKIFTARDRDSRYDQFILNRDQPIGKWKMIPLRQAFLESLGISAKEAKGISKEDFESQISTFVLNNPDSVVQLARPDYKSVGEQVRKMIDLSAANPTKFYHLQREQHSDMYFLKGKRLLFYSQKLKEVDGQLVAGEPLTTIWDDLLSNNLHNEGGVKLPKGKKPEALIKRVIEMSTDKGDYVLDSFGGSGTTGAVAHKMDRKWIMIELGQQCEELIVPRLSSVISGKDDSGVTSACNWKGGGGFKFMTLAPSLLEKDDRGNWVISKKYDATMLAAAVCKHEGFKFHPDQKVYWKQGYSTEKDFIFVTTQFLTAEHLQRIHDQLKPDETLLISAKAFKVPANKFDRITLKKIPQSLLTRGVEFGRDNYSLNIKEPIQEEMDMDAEM
ncbi:DNA methyltransferase [Bdellovibrio bacteriovorus]|uniref:DNA methyltransferase n=1 Tax=Bdellovibrio bacteriovorus TaxID=959 RepID=A0A150WPM0_BDEBC|nr:site-specific DNA-methyltransferase [Bdellovibrio bacteriovorus]KYG66451.1 DNA methyltransferase [Bdellovibrio bacteriovorus]